MIGPERSARSPLGVVTILLVTVLVAGGCFSKKAIDKQRYLLDAPSMSMSGRQTTPAVAASVKLERVHISPLYDSKGFVYRTGPRRYETEFYHEFYVSPAAVFEEALFEWLRAAGIFKVVRPAQDPESATWRLAVRIDELYADVTDRGAPKAVLAMSVELRKRGPEGPGTAMSRQYVAVVPIAGPGADDLLDGWSAGLGQVLTDLDADLRRSQAAPRP